MPPEAADKDIAIARLTARLDRLPQSPAIWKLIVLLGLGFFFELYDLLYTGSVAPRSTSGPAC